jgi:hypothetical protein
MRPYRQDTLKTHTDFAAYYQRGSPFPAQSSETATCVADEAGKVGCLKS